MGTWTGRRSPNVHGVGDPERPAGGRARRVARIPNSERERQAVECYAQDERPPGERGDSGLWYSADVSGGGVPEDCPRERGRVCGQEGAVEIQWRVERTQLYYVYKK